MLCPIPLICPGFVFKLSVAEFEHWVVESSDSGQKVRVLKTVAAWCTGQGLESHLLWLCAGTGHLPQEAHQLEVDIL